MAAASQGVKLAVFGNKPAIRRAATRRPPEPAGQAGHPRSGRRCARSTLAHEWRAACRGIRAARRRGGRCQKLHRGGEWDDRPRLRRACSWPPGRGDRSRVHVHRDGTRVGLARRHPGLLRRRSVDTRDRSSARRRTDHAANKRHPGGPSLGTGLSGRSIGRAGHAEKSRALFRRGPRLRLHVWRAADRSIWCL